MYQCVPRINPFGFIHVKFKYFYKRNIGEYIDRRPAYIVNFISQQFRYGSFTKDILVRRCALPEIFRLQRGA